MLPLGLEAAGNSLRNCPPARAQSTRALLRRLLPRCNNPASLNPKRNRKLFRVILSHWPGRKLALRKRGSGAGVAWRWPNGGGGWGPAVYLLPILASFWDAACRALNQRLGVTGAGLGAWDLVWEELLAPPAPGRDLVILKRRLNGQDESPCFLYLSCDPNGGEKIVSVGILSSARNMEVYVGEEYCGTSRGQKVCNVLGNSEHEKIALYRKYPKLESSTHACKIKLLSFGEKQCVFISKVVVHVRPVTEHSSSSPDLGSRIDLERVTIMESMGSKLSPGAQQLMSMVRVQQQQCRPLGELLPSLWGNAAYQRVIDRCSSSASGAFPRASSTPFPLRTGLTSDDKPVFNNEMEEQPVCSYLEKILSKNTELMEKKLTDYIDQRIQKLQAHIDDKVALLADLLRTPSPLPSGTPLRHCDSGLSNGER
ncbi:LOW QUALITY PROTEIN: ATPase PAAT-like [Rhynchonycteris naso]